MNNLFEIKRRLRQYSNPQKAKAFMRYFKTKKGEYGEGDKFIGVTLPEIRTLVKLYKDLSLPKLNQLIKSKYHEERTVALAILCHQFRRGNPQTQNKIYNLYLKNTKYINNWDLVDISAPTIVGGYLQNKNRKILYTLAKSKLLWERRIAVIATFHFIGLNEYSDSLKIARILLHDREDLIHKATGWMLREIGKHNLKTEETFLKKYYFLIPRTMLRYAIEKFPENKRKKYLLGLI